jgi:murein DD-endopeptidase MepM/ murein hydrolase activator NlpD
VNFPSRRRRNVNLRRRRRLAGVVVLGLLLAGGIAFRLFRDSAPAEPPPPTRVAEQPTSTATVVLEAAATPSPAALLRRTPAPAPTALPPPTPLPIDPLFHNARLTYAPDFYTPEIQALFEQYRSPLRETSFRIGDRRHSLAETLVNLSSLYNLNPRLLLALLEYQSGLISSSAPTPDQLAWAAGYRGDGGNRRGLYNQLRWANRELRWAMRDYAERVDFGLPPLEFADGTRLAVNADVSLSWYMLARVLAPTTTSDRLGRELDGLVQTYRELFGDPRPAPDDWPAPAEPFLHYPLDRPARITSFFDHEAPFLRANGSLISFWGRREEFLSYDGHTGWDYGSFPPDQVLAAAAGRVVFAGNSDDGCATPARAVIIDHGNGYRTLYWHLASLAVSTGDEVGQGEALGISGSSGCVTGPHLHFQVQYLGRDIDPFGWCGDGPDPWAANAAGQQSHWLWADMASPCAPPPPGMIVVDDSSPGFRAYGNWQDFTPGYGGSAHYIATQGGAGLQPWQQRPLDAPALAIWQAELPAAGRYRVRAYLPYLLNGLDDSRELHYLLRHAAGETLVEVNGETFANGWADLGTYEFAADGTARVVLSDLAGDQGRGAWADAIAWENAE